MLVKINSHNVPHICQGNKSVYNTEKKNLLGALKLKFCLLFSEEFYVKTVKFFKI